MKRKTWRMEQWLIEIACLNRVLGETRPLALTGILHLPLGDCAVLLKPHQQFTLHLMHTRDVQAQRDGGLLRG